MRSKHMGVVRQFPVTKPNSEIPYSEEYKGDRYHHSVVNQTIERLIKYGKAHCFNEEQVKDIQKVVKCVIRHREYKYIELEVLK